jgi:hypothetical protein
MRDREEADNKKLPLFSEDPKLCGRTTDTFVRPLFFPSARAVHVCSSCSLARVLLERPLERLSSVGSQFNHRPLTAKSASKHILEEDRR